MKTSPLDKNKASYMLFLVCFLVYAVISMTKNAFGASIASIVSEGLLTKSLAGVINAGYYLFYGGAQLLLVKFVDRISPVKLINISLIGALISLAGFAVATNFWVMLVLWCLAGLMQFAIWPAVIRIIAQYLVPEHKGRAMVYMAFACCIGMLANYATASIVLKLSGWRMIFNLSFILVIITTLIWVITTKRTFFVLEKRTDTEEKQEQQKKPQGARKVFLASGIMLLLIPSLVRTMMDLGIKSWVPTMITENYNVSPSFASMLTTILLLINLAGVYIVNAVYPKYIKNEVVCFGLCFVIAFPFMLLLLLIGKIPVGIVVLLLTLVTTFMYSGHQLINVIIPSKFASLNLTGGVASILNAVASFGAVAGTFGNGYLADNFSWTTTITVWNIMAVIAAVFSFLAARRWNRFIKGSEN